VGFENFESLTRSNNEPMLRKVLDCSIVQWRGLDMLGVSYATIREDFKVVVDTLLGGLGGTRGAEYDNE
jgi:hypothetical protein